MDSLFRLMVGVQHGRPLVCWQALTIEAAKLLHTYGDPDSMEKTDDGETVYFIWPGAFESQEEYSAKCRCIFDEWVKKAAHPVRVGRDAEDHVVVHAGSWEVDVFRTSAPESSVGISVQFGKGDDVPGKDIFVSRLEDGSLKVVADGVTYSPD